MIEDRSNQLRFSPNTTKSIFQVIFLFASVFVVFWLVSSHNSLFVSAIISITLYFILNPLVNFFERNNLPRTLGSLLACCIFYLPFGLLTYYGIASLTKEINRFEQQIPILIENIKLKVQTFEADMIDRFDFLESINISVQVTDFITETSGSFLTKSPEIIGSVAWLVILLPILTFFFLRDGQNFRYTIIDLTPNKFFESVFKISFQMEKKIGSYIIAKIIEAILIGILTFIALSIMNFPFALLLSVIAALTNIIPYFGPVLGFAPIVAIPLFDQAHAHLLTETIVATAVINVLDLAVIFPLLVSRIIDLHPMVVLVSVIIGGSIGGPMGLLIAIPITAMLKIFALEVLKINPSLRSN